MGGASYRSRCVATTQHNTTYAVTNCPSEALPSVDVGATNPTTHLHYSSPPFEANLRGILDPLEGIVSCVEQQGTRIFAHDFRHFILYLDHHVRHEQRLSCLSDRGETVMSQKGLGLGGITMQW